MKNLWNVTLPWAWSGKPDDEEGTYTATVGGDTEEDAKRNTAIEMADADAKVFDDDDGEDRQRYIDTRVTGWGDVCRVQDNLQQALTSTYDEELFPDGVRREVNLVALGKLIAENRAALMV